MTAFKEYREEINRIFSRNTRGGFVDYYHCRRLANEMMELLEQAVGELSSRGEYKELFDLVNKGYLKWGKTNKDDSDGETGYFVKRVIHAWDLVYEANDSRIPHTGMYDWFIKQLNGSVMDYMEDYIYEYMIFHFPEPVLLQKKYDFLQHKIAEAQTSNGNYHDDFQIKRCREYLMYVMADMQKPIEEIRNFADSFQSYSKRKILAEIEKRYGNMDAVIYIYKELAREEDERPWARENWHVKLMEIYKEMGDEKHYREELLAAVKRNLGDEELWQEYKSNFTAEEWPSARDAIFSNVKVGNYSIILWYAMEGQYDLVMEAIEAGAYMDQLKQYEKVLMKLYPDRCLKVIADQTQFEAETSNNRKDYKRVAKNLKWMQKFPGGREIAAELANEYRVKYKLRRAMMEEIAEF